MKFGRATYRLNPDVAERLSWGRPDSPQRSLCAYCHGPLPEVPLMMWNEKGGCVSLCDECVHKCIEVKR